MPGFQKIRKLLNFLKSEPFNRKFRNGTVIGNVWKFGFSLRASFLFGNSGKCCSIRRGNFPEIPTRIFHRMENGVSVLIRCPQLSLQTFYGSCSLNSVFLANQMLDLKCVTFPAITHHEWIARLENHWPENMWQNRRSVHIKLLAILTYSTGIDIDFIDKAGLS